MIQLAPVDRLDPTHVYWVAAVTAPCRDWSGAPGCRKGARYLVDPDDGSTSRQARLVFDSRAGCLEWMMAHRSELVRDLPGASVVPVNYARWLLGLD
ncbi:hypothetical protein HMF7854_08370 [Sphingomonas ginkgonis]|uniref:Uncharacterized protein n=1 Tax=Sphingomonas ginkgonis TaxID=2315330 RepID=A0A3R9X7X3_9SPHN|nr:hypothetical protein [Sphingomonas ginkgonis]RST30852.1 hypothetical protein HMF7854_08370 [Sphingomonas ginkgonis]